MNRTNLNSADGTRASGRLDDVAAPQDPIDPRDPRLWTGAAGARAFSLSGHSGHGGTAVLRRQPMMIVNGRVRGGYTGEFELICCECGDNPSLDYSQISPRLQNLRGPYRIGEGLIAYVDHIGLT